MIERYQKLLRSILNIPLLLLSKIVPKDPNIWIFGAWAGKKYADNSKILFEYIQKNHSEIRAIWLSKNKVVVEELRAKGYECYYTYSFTSIIIGLRAQYSIFVQNNDLDSMLFLNNGSTKLVQLFHGIPLKKIGLDHIDYSTLNYPIIRKFLLPHTIEKYDLIIACSKEDQKNFTTAFNNKNVKITGYPRNDLFYNTLNEESSIFKIVYLPTYRGRVGNTIDLFGDYRFDIEAWQDTLKKYNIHFYIKMHPASILSGEIIDKLSNSANIKFLDDIDLAEFLPMTDLLITDYSSVYFDYLLANKPIIFAPFDYDQYLTQDRKLYYDYDKVTPGPQCNSWNKVLEWIVIFKKNPKLYEKDRLNMKHKFHKYQDGNSANRVYSEISSLV